MDKKELIAAFIERLEHDLVTIKRAALATYEAATHEESKPENEYDTRGLEASYLAGAQAKRAAEIDEVLKLFRNTSFKEFGPEDRVANTALVNIDLDGKRSQVLVMPMGGGTSCQVRGDTIQIVTPKSTLGESLLGLRVGDTAEYEVRKRVRECEVIAIS